MPLVYIATLVSEIPLLFFVQSSFIMGLSHKDSTIDITFSFFVLDAYLITGRIYENYLELSAR